MAKSRSHKFGQVVGEAFEGAVASFLSRIAATHGLFLDRKGKRSTRPGRKKVTWLDKSGDAHDFDYVLERGGTDTQIGDPVAFIEIAWRGYTRHSRSKVQEMQGAILPVMHKYEDHAPFAGAMLAGNFSEDALEQLRHSGFAVAHIPYKTVVKAFATVGIQADYNESTSESDFRHRARQWKNLTPSQRETVAKRMVNTRHSELRAFSMKLGNAITRRVECVIVLALHGRHWQGGNIAEAMAFISGYDVEPQHHPFTRFEIEIRYSNGDKITGSFGEREHALGFLRRYA